MNKPKCCICDKEWTISTERDDDGLSYILRHPFDEDCILYGLIWTFENEAAALAAAQPKAVYRYAEEMKDLLRTAYYVCRNNCSNELTASKIKNLLAKLEDE